MYERELLAGNSFSTGVKGGVGLSFSSVLFPSEFSIPVGGYFLYGKRKSHLDLSINISNYILQQYDYEDSSDYKELRVLIIPSIVYRYQKPEGGLLFRTGLSAIMNFNSVSNSFSPWVDLSVGWAF
jgi:hypothetical protein